MNFWFNVHSGMSLWPNISANDPDPGLGSKKLILNRDHFCLDDPIKVFCFSGSFQRKFLEQTMIVYEVLLLNFDNATSLLCTLDFPLSKGNQAATPKIERPNGKNTKSKFFFKSVKNWCGQLT